jgi:hypothetical protein
LLPQLAVFGAVCVFCGGKEVGNPYLDILRTPFNSEEMRTTRKKRHRLLQTNL